MALLADGGSRSIIYGALAVLVGGCVSYMAYRLVNVKIETVSDTGVRVCVGV